MTNTSPKSIKDKVGFTLIELMVTLMIISTMLLAVLPRTQRSQKSRDHYEAYTTLVETIHYAIDIASQTHQGVSLILDLSNHSFYARMDDYPKGVKEEILRQVHTLPKGIGFTECQGFDSRGDLLVLTFVPTWPWPVASVIVTSDDVQKKICLTAGSVTIQDVSGNP